MKVPECPDSLVLVTLMVCRKRLDRAHTQVTVAVRPALIRRPHLLYFYRFLFTFIAVLQSRVGLRRILLSASLYFSKRGAY